MSIARALALHLTGAGLVTYTDLGESNTFLGVLPDEADECVALFTQPGTSDRSGDWESQSVLVKVRGPVDDALSPEQVARAIHGVLRDSRGVWAAGDRDEVRVTRVMADPAYDTGRDRKGRHTWAVRAVVAYRPVAA